MAAGTYLSVTSERDLARKELAQESEEIRTRPTEEEREVVDFMRERGFTDTEIAAFLRGLRRQPSLLLEFMAAHELRLGRVQETNAVARAAWMFGADLLAALFPVVPFAVLPLGPARVASIAAAGMVLTALGVGRGLIAGGAILSTTLKTLLVAATAAGAGYAIGLAVSALSSSEVPSA